MGSEGCVLVRVRGISPVGGSVQCGNGPVSDVPTAIGVGLLLAAVFIVAVIVGPKLVLLVVVAVLGFGAVEYFDKVSEKGYRPATMVGILACVATPIAAYWAGAF